MAGAGSISAMMASLKANRSLLKKRDGFKRFAKNSDLSDAKYQPLSREENLKIIAENKKQLRIQTRNKRWFGLILIVLLMSMFVYGFLIISK